LLAQNHFLFTYRQSGVECDRGWKCGDCLHGYKQARGSYPKAKNLVSLKHVHTSLSTPSINWKVKCEIMKISEAMNMLVKSYKVYDYKVYDRPNVRLFALKQFKLSGLKSPHVRHWLMSALRGKADIRLRSAIGEYQTLVE